MCPLCIYLLSHLCFIIHSCLAIQHGHLKPSAPAHAQMSDFVGLGGSQIKAKQSDSPVARGALLLLGVAHPHGFKASLQKD